MRLVYLLGQPGSGKTTAVHVALASLGWHLAPVGPLPPDLADVPHELILDDLEGHGQVIGAHLGAPRPGPFTGTDTLTMSIAPRALAWAGAAVARYPLVIGEGDRLGNRKWLDAVASAPGVELRVVLLNVPDSVAAERRERRRAEHGLGAQSPTWLKGRVTKTANLRPLAATIIDGTLDRVAVGLALARVLSAP